jgi:hypothetical protein
MERRPLGAYEAFAEWSGHPRWWGPDHRWQVSFAGGVIDGLLQVLDEHIASAQRRSRCPAVIGCSPWLTPTRRPAPTRRPLVRPTSAITAIVRPAAESATQSGHTLREHGRLVE